MKKLWFLTLLAVPFAFALPQAEDELIQLDKDWGVANLKADRNALEKVYASDVLGVFPEGIAEGKGAMLEGLEAAASTNYVTSGYKVMMLGSDTAVMAHNAGTGENLHRSLHVFVKRDGRWQVVATGSIPASSD